jgi:hypothetical protein
VSLVARLLEEAGIPTVILGSGKDIVEHCGVPRFLFSDFPLGNPCGVPWDREMQHAILRQALDLFETAEAPRTTKKTPYSWDGDAWRTEYMEIRAEDREELLKKGEENRRERAEKRAREV